MTNFTVRVELHQADAGDYEKLHTAMEEGGFVRTIKSKDGKVYQLPSAEYRFASKTEGVKAVCDKAANIAKAIKPNPAILVSKASLTSWKGLQEVK